jgi:hypothetical protein
MTGDPISRECQKRYLRLIKLQTAGLCGVALIGAFSYDMASSLEPKARLLIVVFSIIVLGLLSYQQSRNYMKGWQNARFAAESILSNAWLFVFKIGAHAGNEKAVDGD